MTLKLGQKVQVEREGVTPDDRLNGHSLRGTVVNLFPPTDSLAGCVMVGYEHSEVVQWVHTMYLREI
jgi:hypothetical protein